MARKPPTPPARLAPNIGQPTDAQLLDWLGQARTVTVTWRPVGSHRPSSVQHEEWPAVDRGFGHEDVRGAREWLTELWLTDHHREPEAPDDRA